MTAIGMFHDCIHVCKWSLQTSAPTLENSPLARQIELAQQCLGSSSAHMLGIISSHACYHSMMLECIW